LSSSHPAGNLASLIVASSFCVDEMPQVIFRLNHKP